MTQRSEMLGMPQVIPDGRATRDFDRPVVLAIPADKRQRGPCGGRIGEHLAQRGQSLAFEACASTLSRKAFRRWRIQRDIEA